MQIIVWTKFAFHHNHTFSIIIIWVNTCSIVLQSFLMRLYFHLYESASSNYFLIYFINNKVQRIYAINFYVVTIFDSLVFSGINKKIFVWLFIYLDYIWIKIFCIDNGIKKVVCKILLVNSKYWQLSIMIC